MSERLLQGIVMTPAGVESEPVLVEPVGAWVRLTLDDGTAVTLPRDELADAISEKVERAA